MASDKENKNGWNEYSRLVLAELETLNSKFQYLSEELTEAREDILKNGSRIKRVQDELVELKEWRKDMSEIISPTQLKEVKKDVEKEIENITLGITEVEQKESVPDDLFDEINQKN